MTDLALLKELLALLDASSATTIEIRRGFTTYRVSRDAVGGGMMVPAGLVHAATASASGVVPSAPAAAGAAAPAAEAAPATRLVEVKSPMVGTFYRAPEPGAEPYAKPGSRVSVGQTLCIIEAMKIMNELESEVAGVVREVLVEDAQPVEFGQVLFRVEPNA
jgi:acetyl-CoA carboxylase biotin carboxyl carrier protein